MVLWSHFWLYLGGFMLAKVTSICKNDYLLNLVSENSILVSVSEQSYQHWSKI